MSDNYQNLSLLYKYAHLLAIFRYYGTKFCRLTHGFILKQFISCVPFSPMEAFLNLLRRKLGFA